MKDIYGVRYCDYPIGKIVEFGTNVDPNTLYPGTKWSRYAPGRATVGYNASDADFNSFGKTGGAKTHTLINEESPPHEHKFNRPSWFNGDFVNGGTIYTPNGYKTSMLVEETVSKVGGGKPHNNMQPYVVVAKWIRNS